MPVELHKVILLYWRHTVSILISVAYLSHIHQVFTPTKLVQSVHRLSRTLDVSG